MKQLNDGVQFLALRISELTCLAGPNDTFNSRNCIWPLGLPGPQFWRCRPIPAIQEFVHVNDISLDKT